MGVRWWWGWEMRWHKGGSSTCLLSTWQELGSEELSQQLCSLTFPTCHSQPPALLWEGAGIYPGQTFSSWETAFLPHLQGILHGEVGQQDLPGPSANRSCMPWGLRAVVGRWSKGKSGYQPLLVWTVGGIQARHKKQGSDIEQRFMCGT